MHERSSEGADIEAKRDSWDIPSGANNLAKNIRCDLEIVSELLMYTIRDYIRTSEDDVADIKTLRTAL